MEDKKDSINYSLEVRKRIQKAGLSEFKKLVLALPKNKQEETLKPLPKVNGFRKGKDTEIRLQKFYLRSNSWNVKDWSVILNAWYMYTELQVFFRNVLGFNTRSELETIIESLISSKKHRHKIISNLVQSAQIESVTQESLERWLLFSPLPQDQTVSNFIAFTPKQSLSDFNSRLSTIDNDIIAIKREAVNTNQLQVTNKAVQKITTDLNMLSVQLGSVIGKVNNTVERIIQAEEKQDTLVEDLADFAKGTKSIQNKVTTMTKKINSLEKEMSSASDKIDNIFKSVESLQSFIDDYSLLTAKVEAIKNTIELSSYNLSKPSEVMNNKKSESPLNIPIAVESKSVIDDSVLDLNTKEEIVSHLEQNLKQLGVKHQHARLVAKEVVIALASGQLVTLQGSLALSVAERCAACLVGGNYKLIKIPFGCIESRSLEEIVCDLFEESKSTNRPIAIIFEGINRSAFEVYGSYVRQFIIERIMQFNTELHSIFMFATINDGPAMIPIGRETLELGPLITVDSLRWTNKAPTSVSLGSVSKTTFAEEFYFDKIEYELEDSIVPEWLQILGGPLWRRMLLRTNSISMELSPSTDPFESTLFGWIIPLALCLNTEQVSDFIEFMEQDDRLKLLMMKYAPEVFTSDAIEAY